MDNTGNLYGNMHHVLCLALLMVFETVTIVDRRPIPWQACNVKTFDTYTYK